MIVVANVLRVLSIAFYAATLVGAVWVVATYYGIYLRERHAWIGLLPKHVVLIGLSYIATVIDSIVEIIPRWGQSITFFTPLNLLAGVTGSYAIVTMLKYQRKRMLP